MRARFTTASLIFKTFFLHFKVAWPLEKKDMPKFTKKPAKPYTDQELNRLLAQGTVDEIDLVMFFYGCGGREQEVDHGLWTDLCFERSVFYIEKENGEKGRYRVHYQRPEEGEIPLDGLLMERYRERQMRYPKTRHIFPGKDGKPSGHLLRIIKRFGTQIRNELRSVRQPKGPEFAKYPVCRRAILHRFRKNFATLQHRAGTDVRTIQKWLRHSSLETTLAYLAASENDAPGLRARVNSAYSHLVVPTA